MPQFIEASSLTILQGKFLDENSVIMVGARKVESDYPSKFVKQDIFNWTTANRDFLASYKTLADIISELDIGSKYDYRFLFDQLNQRSRRYRTKLHDIPRTIDFALSRAKVKSYKTIKTKRRKSGN